MRKNTKRFRFRTKKNKTRAKHGGETLQFSDKPGVVDMVSDKLSQLASSASQTIEDTGLKIIGLERTHSETEQPSLLDKTGSTALTKVNDILSSDSAQETTASAAKTTANLISNVTDTFNKELDDPVIKENVKKSIEHASEIADVFLDSAKEPANKLVDITTDAVTKISSASLSGAIKVGTDALGAVPFVGAIIDAGKMINDGSKAIGSVVEAGSMATDAAAEAFIETKENMDEKMNKLNELNQHTQLGGKILSRVDASIKQFENISKKKYRFLKRPPIKTKRVRFAV